ncbi:MULTISPECIES: hypothetical protein [unclassified Methylobacterium]|uniref:hypothetical protein n=1 Tax=unclassified Methylobacterium TaxID=2615210 RepID=UPI0005B921CC|nr:MULTISPECIES: hypothetical protein [unclassified Methylobacterium]SFV12819.1 hypothetical protein SAMN02799643_05782 [Methylobacterium sp. UNCCL125]
MITARLPHDTWLWTAHLASRERGHVCNGRPIRAVRYEGTGLARAGVYEVDAEPGTLLVATPAGMSAPGDGPWGGRHAVYRLEADGALTGVTMADAADELDPEGALARRHHRLVLGSGLDFSTTRIRMPEGHGYEAGTGSEWRGYWAIVEKVTARQIWVRGPSLAEMQDAGLPVAPSDSPEAVAAAEAIRSAA